MKKLIQEILPPIVYKAIQSLRNHLYSPKPKWNKISGGILEGCIIYVPTEQFYFKEMIEGAYDNFFCDFLKKVDLESQTIIDIGGHIGYHSMCFSKLTGKKGKVYVFEPNVFNVERMELIFGKNRDISDNISINKFALSDSQGTATFNFSQNIDNSTSFGGYIEGSYKPLSDDVYEKAGFTSMEVKVDTLDNFVTEKKITNLKLIKIDVEGAEHKVLEGGRKTLESLKPIILVEIHSVSAMLYVAMILFPATDKGTSGRVRIYTDTSPTDTATSAGTLFTDFYSIEYAGNYQDDYEKLLLVMESEKHEDRKRQKAQWRREQKEIRRLKR
jgi:FkbM family methyltransferase